MVEPNESDRNARKVVAVDDVARKVFEMDSDVTLLSRVLSQHDKTCQTESPSSDYLQPERQQEAQPT